MRTAACVALDDYRLALGALGPTTQPKPLPPRVASSDWILILDCRSLRIGFVKIACNSVKAIDVD